MNSRTSPREGSRHQFHDHFSGVSANYAAFRPSYPETLFRWLASVAPARSHAWDCATGTGQAALGLARYFGHVTATDASREQIAAAALHPRIDYRIVPAEASEIQTGSVDLVTVAQALHWLDIGRFFREAERVLVPGGVLAVWAYGAVAVEGPETGEIIREFYHDEMGPYWPEERSMADSGYADIELPMPELKSPVFSMRVSWTSAGLSAKTVAIPLPAWKKGSFCTGTTPPEERLHGRSHSKPAGQAMKNRLRFSVKKRRFRPPH